MTRATYPVPVVLRVWPSRGRLNAPAGRPPARGVEREAATPTGREPAVYDGVVGRGGRVQLTIEISSPGARLYGHLLVGREPIGRSVAVMPGVTARRTRLLEAVAADGAGVVTVALDASDGVTAGDLAEWLFGRLSTYRGTPVAPEEITIGGETIEFDKGEIARVIGQIMKKQTDRL